MEKWIKVGDSLPDEGVEVEVNVLNGTFIHTATAKIVDGSWYMYGDKCGAGMVIRAWRETT